MNFKDKLTYTIGVNIDIMKCNIDHFFCCVRRVIKYLPIIWKDEDWDFGYFVEVLGTKLNLMKEYEINYGLSSDKRQSIEEIDGLLNTINRYENHYEEYEKEHKGLSIEEQLGLVRVEDRDDTGFLSIRYVHADTGKEMTAEEEETISKYYKDMWKDEEKTWKKIWNLVAKNARNWGD